MITRGWIKTAMLIAGGFVPATAAQASFVYSTTVTVANDPTPAPAPPGVVSQSIGIGNGNSLVFTGTQISVPADQTVSGGADINFGSVSFTPDANNNATTPFHVNYDFQVTITDQTTGMSKVVDFTGSLTGSATGGVASGVAISSTVNSTGANPTMLDFGSGVFYSILDKGGVGPGTAGGTRTDGTFQANLSSPATVPEPSSFAMLTFGGLLFGLVARRRMARHAA